jgi:hypothetical protein
MCASGGCQAPSFQLMARHTCCAVQYGTLLMEQVAAAAAAAEAADSAAPAPAAEPDLLPALLGDVEVTDVLARLVRQAAARQLTHAPLELCAPAWAARPRTKLHASPGAPRSLGRSLCVSIRGSSTLPYVTCHACCLLSVVLASAGHAAPAAHDLGAADSSVQPTHSGQQAGAAAAMCP